MASYLEALMADRERQRSALMAQIEQEVVTIRQLREELAKYGADLDQKIIRLMIFRSLFGSVQQETQTAQVEVEEASKPHTYTREQIVFHERVLQALQEALARLQQGGSVDSSGTPTIDAKLTVADILGE